MIDKRHGSPYDRGSADSYYQRGRSPHYYCYEQGKEGRVTDLTKEQIAEYHLGYDENEAICHHKIWE